MAYLIAIGMLVLAFLIAGTVNVVGTATTRRDFALWGFPPWWGRLTGIIEIVAAGLIAMPATRAIGMAIAMTVTAAAIVTVVRHRDYTHLAPLAVFATLLVAPLVIG